MMKERQIAVLDYCTDMVYLTKVRTSVDTESIESALEAQGFKLDQIAWMDCGEGIEVIEMRDFID